jgi:CubicO group peptidase (beta-lactamase class C family)
MDTLPLEAPAVTWHTTPRPRRRLGPVLAMALCAVTLASCAGPSPLTAQDAADKAVQRGLVGAVFEHLTAETEERGIAGQRREAPAAPLLGTERMMLESCSKAMTGMIAARIIEKGSIDWSTTLGAALPDLAATMRPEYRSVTLEDLLAHRGGVAAFTETVDVEPFLAYVQGFVGTLPGDETARRRFFTAWLLQQPPPPQVTPGQTFLYSNAGFAIAAAMMEAAAGKTWEVLFDEELLQPLGVSASFGAPTLRSAMA